MSDAESLGDQGHTADGHADQGHTADGHADPLMAHLDGAAAAVGHVLLPGYPRHVREILTDLDAEAAADDKMLEGMGRAFHQHGPLERPDVTVDALRAVDPEFDDEAFLVIARETFYKVRAARSKEAPEMSATLLSPALQTDLRTAVAGDVVSHRHQLLPWLEISSALITAAGVRNGREQVTVRFHVSGEEFDRDDTTSAVVCGDEVLRTWDEDWRFERDPSVDSTAVDRDHVLAFEGDGWMVAHRGWVVTAIDRLPSPLPA